jgi:heterodisulfide reductase subunit C
MPDSTIESVSINFSDDDFAKIITQQFGGDTVKYCFQCGTCSSVCPVAYIDSNFNPKRIMKMVLLNMKKELLESDFIWLCTSCYSCSERCPQGVKIPYVINALQRMASENGFAHMNYKAGIDLLTGHGRLVEVNKFINKTREKFGMPKLEEHTNEIKVLLTVSKVKKLMEKNRKDQMEEEGN